MAKSIPPFSQRDFSRGVYTNVNSPIVYPNSVKHSINFVYDEDYGNAKLRKGMTIVGSQLVGADNDILALFNFRDRNGSNHALLSAVNVAGDGSVSIFNTATGDTLYTSLTADAPVRFEEYLDEVAFQNGTTSPASWQGTGSFGTTGGNLDIANMPIGVDIINFKDRMCVLTAGGVLKRSSIPTSPNFSSISWTSGNDSIPVDPDSTSYTGAGIGLAKVSGLLLIFKERALYSFNGNATQTDFLFNVGCSSVRSIATGGGFCFFFNPDGIWMTNGGAPVRISRPVHQYIENMSTANYSKVAGGANGKYYWCSIGNVTIGLTTYNNITLRYTIGTQEWAVLSTPNQLTCFSSYVNGTAVEMVTGDASARVYRLDTGNTDNGTAIEFELISQDLEFGSRGVIKDLHSQVMVYSEESPGIGIQIRVDKKNWISVEQEAVKEIEDISIQEDLVGNVFEFRCFGSSSGEQFTFKGFEFPKATLESYTTNE